MKSRLVGILSIATAVVLSGPASDAVQPLRALIIDGQNNHNWIKTTPVLKWILEDSGRFDVTVFTTPPIPPREPLLSAAKPSDEQQATYKSAVTRWREDSDGYKQMSSSRWAMRPKFQDFDVLIGNYNGHPWPEEMRSEFIKFVRNGGGFVSIHAANNSFPEWPEYNEMIGVGGWGGRNETSGPMLRWRDGKVVRDETPGAGGTHGPQDPFLVETRNKEHPILKGLPLKWMHPGDELYAKLRGPAKNLTVLATAFSPQTSEHEPILMVIDYGLGRVFHTVLGDNIKPMQGLGFQVTLVRGAEWAATGKVTIPAPAAKELPSDQAAIRPPNIQPLP